MPGAGAVHPIRSTDRAMRAPAIEILHVIRQHHPQMALIEDEQMV
jgi:hypothetical protein